MHITEVGSSGSASAKVTLLQAQIMYLSGEKEKAASVLESLATDAKDAEVWLELAKLHEEVGKHVAVLTDLMEVCNFSLSQGKYIKVLP
jgi:predicted Zn-dependent protease